METTKHTRSNAFGHFSTVWAVETVKVAVNLNDGKPMDLTLYDTMMDWDQIIMINFLILGSEDGAIRVFMEPRDFATQNMKTMDLAFHEEVYNKVSINKNPDVLRAKINGLMDIRKMNSIRGKKEGQIMAFRDGDQGKVYSWTGSQWKYVGEMIGGPQDAADQTGGEIFGGKKAYHGDRFFPEGNYDFVFDIEDQQGVARQLPFNLGGNTLVAAEKFLAREKWSVLYKEQVMQFLNKHTRPGNNSTRRQGPAVQNDPFAHLTQTPVDEGLRKQMVSFPVYGIENLYR